MDLSLEYFLGQLAANPLLILAVALTLGVILVNGWTDAPNAIATCVVTRCMSARAAILMAAVFNFLGVLIMSMINATVAETITKMVDFGSDSHEAIVALSAALFAIVVWATLAWFFGIPTSESHALIAGLTGGAIALKDVFFERLGSQEDDGYFGVDAADFLREGETVFLWHHYVKDANVVFAFEKGFVSALAVGEEVGTETFLLEVFSEKHTEAFVVFAEKDACTFVHSCISFLLMGVLL